MIRSGSNPINREQVASAATGSSASTIFPRGRAEPLRGPFPSIATMPSGDNEVDRHSGTQIKDALLNALPVENILRPTVSRARHYAKHVLHAERDAGPVV